MFKVGDKVRCISTHPSYPELVIGNIYTVKGHNERYLEYDPFVLIEECPQNKLGYFKSRFKQVSSVSEPFNVLTATDQELADEYRRLADIRYPVADELLQRGYKAFLPDGRAIKLHKEIVFSKTVTETIKL